MHPQLSPPAASSLSATPLPLDPTCASKAPQSSQSSQLPDSEPPRPNHAAPPPSSSNNPLIHQSATLTALADLLATTRGAIRDLAHRLGFRFHTQLLGARRKRTCCLTADEASALIATYHAELAEGPLLDESELEPPDRNLGVVYLLQLEPDYDPGRFKVGFTHTPWTRLNDLLTVAPLAQCVAMWPARRNWERNAITAIAHGPHIGAKCVRKENEVVSHFR